MSEEPPVLTTPDEVHAHLRKSGHRMLDLVIAFTAIFISVVSLVVAIEHGIAQRQLVASNSWPFISTVSILDGDNAAYFGISNAGTGPAKIAYVHVFYKGRPATSPRDLINRCCGKPGGPARTGTQSIAAQINEVDQTVLRPGEQRIMLGIGSKGTDPEIWHRFGKALADITFRTCYCSIFDECWISDMRSITTQRVDRCPANDHPYRPSSGFL